MRDRRRTTAGRSAGAALAARPGFFKCSVTSAPSIPPNMNDITTASRSKLAMRVLLKLAYAIDRPLVLQSGDPLISSSGTHKPVFTDYVQVTCQLVLRGPLRGIADRSRTAAKSYLYFIML